MSIDVKYKDDLNLGNVHNKVLMKIGDKDKRDEYSNKVRELLFVYDKLKPSAEAKPQVMVFGMHNASNVKQRELSFSDKKIIMQRSIVISRYLAIAKRYATINVTKISSDTIDMNNMCHECGALLDFGDNYVTCTNAECGFIESNIDTSNAPSGTKHAPSTASGGCDDIHEAKEESILQAILLLQGKQKKKPPEDCFTKINDYCEKKRINKSTLTIFAIRNMLQQLELNDYYIYINYIYGRVTGKKCPDIKEHEDTVIERYKLLYKHAAHLIRTNKTGGMPRDIILLRSLLQMEGIQVPSEFFPEIKTMSVKEDYNISMRNACNELQRIYPDMNWSFKPI